MDTLIIINPKESQELINWCQSQTLEQEIFTGRLTCRKKKWWGFEAEYYFGRNYIYPRTSIESDRLLSSYRDRFSPNCDSILLYYYEVGGEIGTHLDKKCFDKMVTLINLIEADSDLFGNRPTTRFKWNGKNYNLEHGEVINFDSRIVHSVPKVKVPRYSLQFRSIVF